MFLAWMGLVGRRGRMVRCWRVRTIRIMKVRRKEGRWLLMNLFLMGKGNNTRAFRNMRGRSLV